MLDNFTPLKYFCPPFIAQTYIFLRKFENQTIKPHDDDINYAADGGLYAELVKNRSFEFPNDPLQGWKAFGTVEVWNDGPFERCPHYVRLVDPGHPHKWTGLDNEGFFGIGVKGGDTYRFTVWARVPDGGASELRIELVNTAPRNCGSNW